MATSLNLDWEKVSQLDEWSRKRYLVLVEELGAGEFTMEDFERVLKMHKLEMENPSKLITAFRKLGLLSSREHPKDAKRKIYRLVFEEVPVEKKEPFTKDNMIKLLKGGADLIRTAVDYKVLLLFLFYKAISDKWVAKMQGYLDEGYNREEAYILANSEYLVLYDENEEKLYTWHEVTKSRDTIKEVANSLIRISKMNQEMQELRDLEKLVNNLGLLGLISEDNMHILEGLIQMFNQYDFSDVDYDVLGDAYQWVLAYFAPQKAKEGETYTPKEIIKVLVNLLDIEDGSKVLDPACGSASMLVESYNYVKESKLNGGNPSLELVGQERNEIMTIIAKMNMLLHGIQSYKIYMGDSLRNPRFEQADYVIANPPWNQKGYDENTLSDPSVRKIYTHLGVNGFPPKNKADWAWVQLMLYHARRKVGIVLDSGALFRGGKEAIVRKAVVQKDLISAVILLPEKLFYNTSAAGIIIIFDKNKPPERKGKVLFINASELYVKHPEVRKLNMLSQDNIEKIVHAYREFSEEPGFSRVVSLSEIEEKDYNLNVSLYVVPQEEEEDIDLQEELEEFREIERREEKFVKKAVKYVEEVVRVEGKR